MRAPWTVSALALASALVAPGAALAQSPSACDAQRPALGPGGWALDVSHHQRNAPNPPVNNLKQMSIGAHFIPLEGDQALVFFLGGVHVQDGTSNTFMIGERFPTLSCADADGDGRIGIVLLQFTLRDVRTGELVAGVVVPNDGELDDDGTEDVTVVIGRLTVTAEARTRFWVFGTELPR